MLIEAGCEVRGDRRHAESRCARQARDRRGLVERISRRHHRGEGGRRARRSDRPHRRATARSTPRPSSPRTRQPPRNSSPAWTAPSCCTTPRRSSPMAASSAWARRSASPRVAFMPAGRWGWSSSRPSNMSCTAQARSGLEHRPLRNGTVVAKASLVATVAEPSRTMVSWMEPVLAKRPHPSDARASQTLPAREDGASLTRSMRKATSSTFRPHLKVPMAAPNMRIGLLGGSFNPAHAAHRHISLAALKRLGARSGVVAGEPRQSSQRRGQRT